MKLELLMMNGMLLETCLAFNEQWNNKFYYKAASCWLFLLIHICELCSTKETFIQTFHYSSFYHVSFNSVRNLAQSKT
jgi:hypothetical protein